MTSLRIGVGVRYVLMQDAQVQCLHCVALSAGREIIS